MSLERTVQAILILGAMAGVFYIIADKYKQEKKDLKYTEKEYLDKMRGSGL